MRYFFIIISFIILLTSCKEEPKKNNAPILTEHQVRQPMIKYNQQMIKKEDQQIEDYLQRRGWKFEKTKTGLRYHIIEEGYGVYGEEGLGVVLEYKLSLIRGEQIYDSDTDGPIQFVVDQSEAVSGLNELVKYLRVGARAKVIVPSYLGYGLPGDDNKVPRKATLIYDVYFKEARG